MLQNCILRKIFFFPCLETRQLKKTTQWFQIGDGSRPLSSNLGHFMKMLSGVTHLKKLPVVVQESVHLGFPNSPFRDIGSACDQ